MAFGDYLSRVEREIVELEAFLEQLRLADERIAREVIGSLQDLAAEFQAAIGTRTVNGVLRVSVAAPETLAAKRAFLRKLRKWRADSLRAFGAADPERFLNARRVSPQVAATTRHAARAWRNLVSTFGDPRRFSPMQVAEAAQLREDIRFYRRQFRHVEAYLADLGIEASYGRAENIAAEVERVWRNARNFAEGFTAGTPSYRAGESTPVRTLVTWAGNLAFNANNLRLSSVAHLRGLFSTALVRIAEPLGVCHFMFYLSPESRRAASGLSAGELWQIRLSAPDGGAVPVARYTARVAAVVGRTAEEVTREVLRRCRLSGRTDALAQREMLSRILAGAETISPWPDVFDSVNRQRRGTLHVGWASNLTIHPGSREFFIPVPPTMLAEARAWAASVRSRRGATESAPTAPLTWGRLGGAGLWRGVA